MPLRHLRHGIRLGKPSLLLCSQCTGLMSGKLLTPGLFFSMLFSLTLLEEASALSFLLLLLLPFRLLLLKLAFMFPLGFFLVL